MFLCSYLSIVLQSKDVDVKVSTCRIFRKKDFDTLIKNKFLDYAEANEKLGCRKLADVFKIGKTAANNILKNKQMLREQYEHFHDKTKKRSRPGKYKVINDILYE